MKYILLAGIHAVGKTTLSDKLDKRCGIQSYTISSLIKKAGAKIVTADKYTKEIEKNQDLWKKELRELDYSSDEVILDGHFSLLNKEGEIVELPATTFSGVNITKIILKKENPVIIQSRLLKRDGNKWNIEKIKLFQDTEETIAKKYAFDKNIPLFIYNNTNLFDKLVSFIGER